MPQPEDSWVPSVQVLSVLPKRTTTNERAISQAAEHVCLLLRSVHPCWACTALGFDWAAPHRRLRFLTLLNFQFLTKPVRKNPILRCPPIVLFWHCPSRRWPVSNILLGGTPGGSVSLCFKWKSCSKIHVVICLTTPPHLNMGPGGSQWCRLPAENVMITMW